jgi:16S rRNA (uracil1498-N3)-methyltransferase
VIRLRVGAGQVDGDTVRLGKDQWHYLYRVMRREAGDRLVVLLDEGPRWARVAGPARLTLEEPAALAPPPHPRVLLAQALLKGDHVTVAMRLATEAGVAAVQPVVTERCIVRAVEPARLVRWTAVLGEAAEQCGRGEVPRLHPPVLLPDLQPVGPLVVLTPDGAPLGTVWRSLADRDHLTVLVGPEGGLAPGELADLDRRGAYRAHLGPRIFRAENAGAFAVFLLLQLAQGAL